MGEGRMGVQALRASCLEVQASSALWRRRLASGNEDDPQAATSRLGGASGPGCLCPGILDCGGIHSLAGQSSLNMSCWTLCVFAAPITAILVLIIENTHRDSLPTLVWLLVLFGLTPLIGLAADFV